MVEPDSSPMVERPIEAEPPIAETQLAEEPKPARRGRRKRVAVEAEVTAPEPAPPEAPPAETAEEAAPAEKPARKRRSKKAEAAAEPQPEAAPEEIAVPAASNDAVEEDGEPRRGWWQRTFG